jgi:hypothetical protein
MTEIDELRSLLIEWRNAPDDVWFVEGPIDEEYRKRYGLPQGEQELLISIITALVQTKFEEKVPKITTYVLPNWEDDGMDVQALLSGANGQAIADRVERGEPDEYFVVAAAGDNDSRPPYVVYLARGSMKWAEGWFRLGGTNNNWYDVRTLGLFGNVNDGGGDSVSEERMEDIENDESFWNHDGSLGWALKIKFVGMLGYAECLNWKEWPEELL